MKNSGSGHIVAISSAGGLVGTADLTDYCASKVYQSIKINQLNYVKFAIVGMMESLAAELHNEAYPNIKTTTVFPYFVRTTLFNAVETRCVY